MTLPLDTVRPLLRVRQSREFTDRAPTAAQLEAITEVARWTGSSRNTQPWRFIVLTDLSMIRALADAGMPQTRALRTATAAIAIVLPIDPEKEISRAYDDGRVAERILIAATLIGLGAGIAWVRSDVRDTVSGMLGLPDDRMLRTIVALGHPTAEALRPKSAPGTARLPRSELVFGERWPTDRV